MKIRNLAVVALATASLMVPSAAQAATVTVEDAAGDIAAGADLLSVKLSYGKKIKVVLQHDNLVKSFKSSAGGSVFLDTDADEKGPEFVLMGGFFEGTDYVLLRTDGWKSVGEPLTCKHRLTLDYAADTAKMRFGRACLGKPEEVRAAVKVAGKKGTGDVEIDWMTERRAFTPWVAQG